MRLLIAISVLALFVHAAAATSPIDLGPDSGDFVPLENWLKQRDLHACLSRAPADLLFVVDGSKSVGSSNFHFLLKSALVDTISRFRIGSAFTQVGVLVFSDQVSQVIPIGRFDNKLQLLAEVSKLRYVDSFTSIEAAVEGCSAELHRRGAELNRTETAEAVAERKTLIVFMTDGWDTHGDSLYLRELLMELHLRVSGALALGLEDSNSKILHDLVTDSSLVFNPTTFPEFQSSLLNLLNSHCSDSCHKYEEQLRQTERGLEVTARYVNTVAENFVELSRQRSSLLEYVRQVNASTVFAENDIQRTCERQDQSMLETLVTLRKQYEQKVNNSDFIGLVLEASEANLIEAFSKKQKEQFDLIREVTIKKASRESMQLQEQQIRSNLQARLSSKLAISQANAQTLVELVTRINEQEVELLKMQRITNQSFSLMQQIEARLQKEEEQYTMRVQQLGLLSNEYTKLQTLESGSDAQFKELEQELAFCKSYVQNHETVLFAILCGSGAEFSTLFSRKKSSFSNSAFTELSQSQPLYKSRYLQHLHQMGFFSDASLQFFIGDNVVATLNIDTSRFELANIFSRFHVSSSFPYVASYINSVYRASLSQFRLREHDEFLLLFGDMSKYLKSGKCADLQGVFVVLGAEHRCFPDARKFPQIYIAASPYGGNMTIAIDQLRLATRQLPKRNQRLPDVLATEQFVDETLLFVRAGAGLLAPKLLTDYSTSASVLLEVSDITDLARHYKSSLLNTIDINQFEQITIELYNSGKSAVAQLSFKGPFNANKHRHHSLSGSHASWAWFEPQFLENASPFDARLAQKARFEIYSGSQLLSIGSNMAAACDSRRYFMTIVDGQSECSCFNDSQKPAIYFAAGSRPVTCDSLQQAQSLRIVGKMRMQML